MDDVAYTELHCHSAYSFLDGASMPEELVLQAHGLGYHALALTDHDGLYGSMAFAHTAKAWGIQPITGAEVTLGDSFHLTLLVQTQKGYANLCRLLSEAHLSHPKGEPCSDWETVCAHHEGLLLLTGCRHGELARLVDTGRVREAYELACRYREVFGKENVWIELQQNLVRGDTPRLRSLVDVARKAGLPVVATNNVHYHVRARHRLQDVLVAIKHRTTLDGCHRERRANSEVYLKSPAEMGALFAELPEAIRATEEIAERCADFDLTEDLGYTFPDFNRDREGESADQTLTRVCRSALAARYGDHSPARRREAEDRLQRELDLVRRHRLPGFFLVYRDLMRLAGEVADAVRGPSPARQAACLPPGRGRGSSVSSLICYLVGLSHVDPVQANLSIDRFLTEELVSVPDIDLDFARDIREGLIQKVYAHYGREHAALVCSFTTYRLRSAVRDVGRALGLPGGELDRLATSSEGGSAKDVRTAMEALPEFAGRVDAPLWRDLVTLAEEIAGLPRHISQHVGGMVISSRPLVDCVPLEKARMPGRVVCQWDKDGCEDAGFVKIDFLGLGMLSLVEDCVERIAESRGESVDLSRISFDEAAVYDQICQGDTVGVFQIESRAQIQLLPRTRPRNLDELAIEIAIIRPGPIIGGAVHPYVTRRMEKREADRRGEPYVPPYDHPCLAEALEETLGVILYQDHVIQVAVAMAGFTPGQAERLRRALGRKTSLEAVASLRDRFLIGARSNHVSEDVAHSVFQKILAFSQFGFPKSHSFAFAVLAYQSAWLRRHFPAEYTAALFNSQPMGFYPPHVLVRDAQRRGVEVLPPDVNQSEAKCSATAGESARGRVRMGLNYVKGLGEKVAGHIVRERSGGGRFTSLRDFADRVDLPKKKIERLITAGAFDGWGKGRRELLWDLGLILPSVTLGSSVAAHVGGEANRGTETAGSPKASRQIIRQPPLPLVYHDLSVTLPQMDAWDFVASDYAATGLSTREHLMALLRPELPRGIRSVKQVGEARDGTKAYFAGLVVARQRPETARGILFVLVEDETGMINVVVRSDLYDRKRAVLRGEKLLALVGTVQKQDGTVSVLARDVWPLETFIKHPGAARLRNEAPASHDFR